MCPGVIVKAEPLGVGAKDAAALIGISIRSLRRGVARGAIPGPLRIGGRSIWSVERLRQWFDAGGLAIEPGKVKEPGR